MRRSVFIAFLWSDSGGVPFDIEAAARFYDTQVLFGLPIILENGVIK